MRPNSGFAEDELMDETVFENFSLEMMTVTNGMGTSPFARG